MTAARRSRGATAALLVLAVFAAGCADEDPPPPIGVLRLAALGDACASNANCASVGSACRDGVCCDGTCGGGSDTLAPSNPSDCQACAVALGASADGTCTQTTGNICRAAGGGGCDVAETCPGGQNSCPPDAFASPSSVCRPSSGMCDVQESCNGISAVCPADVFLSSSTLCRPAAGPCDAAESCTGAGASCPVDMDLPNGTACDDGNPCTAGDSCQTGACSPGPPSLQAMPSPVSFLPTPIGTTAPGIGVTLTNAGNASLQITGASSSLSVFPISAAPTWPVTLPMSASSSVTVEFTPTSATFYSGTLTVDLTTCPSVSIPVEGQGQIVDAEVTPGFHDFGPVRIDQPGTTWDFTIVNGGASTVTILAISMDIGTDFTVTVLGAVTLPHVLPSGGSLNFRVHALPTTLGPVDDNVVIATNIPPGLSVLVPVTANGVAPDIGPDRTTIDFGPVDIDGGAASETVTISNTGSASLQLTDILLTGTPMHYVITGSPTTPTMIAVGDDFSITVEYDPDMEMVEPAAMLVVQSDALSGAQLQIPLLGRGADRHIDVTPLLVDFGQTSVGVPSAQQAITIANTGEAPLVLGQTGGTALVLMGQNPEMFEILDPIPAGPVPASMSADALVRFAPTSLGPFTAELYIYSDDDANPIAMVQLSGTGVPPPPDGGTNDTTTVYGCDCRAGGGRAGGRAGGGALILLLLGSLAAGAAARKHDRAGN